MLRVVFAVLLTVALVGVALPAVDTARIERSTSLVEADLAAVERAALDLAASEQPTHRLDRAARRTVTVDVPAGDYATAPVAFVAIGGVPDRRIDRPPDDSADAHDGTAIAYRVGGTTHVRWLPVDVRVLGPDGDLRPAGEPLVLRGSRQVTLALLERNGEPTVVVTGGDADAR